MNDMNAYRDLYQEESFDRFRDALSKSLEKLNKGGLQVKEKQYDALLSIVKEYKDTICILPTGYGKSLIYQLLPFMFDLYGAHGEARNDQSSSFVLVISPLTALMIDQISKLKEHINVTVMKARIDETSDETNRDECHSGKTIYDDSQIIFAHPEALLEDKKVFEHVLKLPTWKQNLKAIVVDEAHLIVEWKDFRPCYQRIGALTSLFPNIPMIALTATATKETKAAIATSLGMYNPVTIESNPDRENISYESFRRPDSGEDKLNAILDPLTQELRVERLNFPLTIIYGTLTTISDCYLRASHLLGPLQYEPVGTSPGAKNRMFTQFHAQYPKHERERIVKELVAGTSKLRLLFVTIAFGIGIDVNNIRRVIHIGVPHTIEEFFQEAGRCGRDGLPSSSTIYFNSHDISSLRNISKGMIEYVSSDGCKREKVLSYFGYSTPRRQNVPDHQCCDYHAKQCKCDDCVIETASKMFEQFSCAQEKDMSSEEESHTCVLINTEYTSELSEEKKQQLRHKLIDFRHTLHGSGKSCVGSVSLTTGISMELIDKVIEHAHELTTVEKVKSKFLLFSNDHAEAIFEIVKNY